MVSFNDSSRSGQILVWVFFMFRSQTKKAGKNVLSQNFLTFSLAKWNQKMHHAKTLNEPKYFIPPKLNVCVLITLAFFFLIEWPWTNKSQNFTCKWLEWKYLPSSEIYNVIFLSAKDLAEFNLNLFIVSIFYFFFMLNVYGKISPRTFLLPIELILEYSSCPVNEIFSDFYRVSFDFAFSWWRTSQFCSLMIWKFLSFGVWNC